MKTLMTRRATLAVAAFGLVVGAMLSLPRGLRADPPKKWKCNTAQDACIAGSLSHCSVECADGSCACDAY